MQFTTDWILPTRVTQDDSVGSSSWNDTNSIFTDDGFNEVVSIYQVGSELPYLSNIVLVINDALATAEDKGVEEYTVPFTETFGGSSDTWSETLTGADINNEKFGFAFAIGTADSGPTYSGAESYYLVVTGFEALYDIPDDATIDGIEVNLDGAVESTGGGTQAYKLDFVQLRVTFTWDIEINAEASSFGGIFINPPNRIPPRKRFRYKVRNPDGDYLGNWQDVDSDPTYKQDINTLTGSMPISFARNDFSATPTVGELLNEDNTNITDESDSNLLIDLAPVSALGEDTNLDTNYDVEVDSVYGQFEPLLNEDDTPILNEDGSMILVEDGYPTGRTIFRGYIPRWELPLTGVGITSEIRSYAQDLDNIVLETEDTVYVDNGSVGESYFGISGGGPTDFTALYQTFTMGAEKVISKVRIYPFAGWFTDVPFTVSIYGGTPSSPGTLYASKSGTVNRNNPVEYYDLVFSSPVTIPAGSFYLQFDTTYAKTGGNPTYPFNVKTSSGAYGGGSVYYITSDTGLFNDTGSDIAFQLYEAGGETTRSFNSYDPSDILREVVDFANDRGARINYTVDSIEDTNTTVSYTFRAQTIKEAIQKILELCPSNWYFYYDFGTDTIYLKEKSATPDRWLRQGQSVVDGKIIKTIEQAVNDVLFTGGGDPALYVRERDTTNVGSTTRKGLKKLSDNRVTDSTTASILSNSEINNYKDPLYAGDVTITEDGTFWLEDVAVGETLGFIGFGTLVDAIIVQGVSKTYNPDIMPLTLTYNLPRVNKRVEDIKRNLDTLETTNNPTEPS